MRTFHKKIKLLFSLLFKKQFIVIHFPKQEETQWNSFGLDIEQVADACDDVVESIEEIIQDYIDCEQAERIGDELIRMTKLN
jgi:hypothetical protein